MVQFATQTHAGRLHDDNEDAIGVDAARQLWLVADGMGGHASGEVASRIVRDTILSSTSASLAEAVDAAHRAVVQAATDDDRYSGMGSTVVAVALHGREAETVWVGDSRVYLWRSGSLRRLSRDHSVMEVLRESGDLTDAQIRTHPQRHLVTQTLGHGDPVASSVRVELRAGDILILCSDGLHDELDDTEMAALLKMNPAPDDAVARLVEAALAKGGRDNISVVAVSVSSEDVPGRWRRLRKIANARPWLPAMLGVALALVLGMLILYLVGGG